MRYFTYCAAFLVIKTAIIYPTLHKESPYTIVAGSCILLKLTHRIVQGNEEMLLLTAMNRLTAIKLPFWVMFMNTFGMAVGFYMMIPLLASYLLHDLLLTVTMVGVISAIRSFSQQGLSVFCGTLADRLGYKRTILIGLFIRTFGFGLFGFVDHIPGLILACFFSGLGAALFQPASYAYYAALSTPEKPDFSLLDT
jgi:fucose permease